MIKSANGQAFSSFINPELDKTRIFNIPEYQRPYSWRYDQCEELFRDLEESESGYFLGSIIWVSKVNEIIDGQQRLTTLGLLQLAIYSKIKELPLKDEELIANRVALKNQLVNSSQKARINLQNQNHNKEDYQYLINSKCIGHTTHCPQNFGNRRISLNYNLFEQKLLDSYTPDQLFNLFEKIRNIIFVCIEVEDDQSAYLLFESMNNRGLVLSPIDLIKNKFIARNGDYSDWKDLIDLLGDNYANQEQFIRNNYNAFRAEYNGYNIFPLQITNEKLKYPFGNKATKTNVIKIYDKLIGKDNDFIETLKRRAGLYSEMLGISESENSSISELFGEFRNAKSTSSFPLILYLYYYKNEFNLTDENFIDILSFLLKFFVRRNITNYPSTGSIPQILMDIIEEINKSSVKDYHTLKSIITNSLISKSSSDDTLNELIRGDMYIQNTDMTRFLLCYLAKEDEKSKETKRDFWALDEKNKKYVWTIEHIFPEGDNIPDCWIKMIANGDKSLAKKHQEEFVHKLGNLTMTGYNSELSNDAFDIKKNRQKNNINIGYNNGLELNQYVFSQTQWTIENIKERTDILAGKILRILSFN